MVEGDILLVGVHVTADIHPFGATGSGASDASYAPGASDASDASDAATISTLYALFDPADAPSFAERVGGQAGNGLVTTVEQRRLSTTDTGYGLRLVIPEAGTLVKGGEFSASVTLPPSILMADGTALLPQLGSYTLDPIPQIFDGLTLPTIGGRTSVVWHGFQDPTLDLEYWYRKVRSG